MAKKRAKKKAEPRSPAPRGQLLAAFALLTALVALAVFLFRDRSNDPRYALDLERAVAEATRGHPDADAIQASLQESLVAVAGESSTLDAGLTQRLREVLRQNPWVQEVRGMRRVFPGGLELEVSFREPYAELEVGGRFLLIDDEGQVLPRALDASRGLVRRLTLRPEGDPEAPIGAWEEAWLRDAIRNGVQVYRDLDQLKNPELIDVLGEAGVVAVDISNHEGRRDRAKAELCLVSMHSRIEPGTGRALPFLIRWGRSSCHRLAAIEFSTRRKLENLRSLVRSRPGGLDGLREIDVRSEDPFAIDR